MKISFDTPDYQIDEEKRTVTCYLKIHVKNAPGYMNVRDIFVGVAYCRPDDEFDVVTGKKISLAKAEIKAYRACGMELSRLREFYNRRKYACEDEAQKLYTYIQHNKWYLDRFNEEV